ncbi:A-kinase anchoring protein 7 isoform X2 [Pseudophryne corroboree]|uniref:A-kinase anchoring protein 7 isoform X2 n=1 Tax=Pseudophryne corroboree TaxID=495146 RepID=UPI003081C6E9
MCPSLRPVHMALLWVSRRTLVTCLVNIGSRAATRCADSDVTRGSAPTPRALIIRAPPPMERIAVPIPSLPPPLAAGEVEIEAAAVAAAPLREDTALQNVQAEKNQKKKRKLGKRKPNPLNKGPVSVKNLLTELPFAGVDVRAVFDIPRTEDKKVKSKRKMHLLQSEDDNESKKQKRANYFVSLPITRSKILDDIQTIQDSVLQKDERLIKAMIPKGSFHLTLFVMHLANEEEVALAVSALLGSKIPIEEILDGKDLVLSFGGMADFKHEVVYGKMTDNNSITTLKQIAETTGNIFNEKGISVVGCKDFVPHLTWMKLSKAPKLRKQGIKKIDTSLYKDFQDHYFGEDTLVRLDLCSMLKKKQQNGYYHTEASIFFVAWLVFSYDIGTSAKFLAPYLTPEAFFADVVLLYLGVIPLMKPPTLEAEKRVR